MTTPQPATIQAGLDPSPIQRKKMFGWYDPGPLLRTAVDVAFSTIFGRHADHRLIEAITPLQTQPYFDYSSEHHTGPDGGVVPILESARAEIWIDYVADVGDGWDSTYAIAYCLSQHLTLVDPKGKEHATQRGAILVMGGDEVYPTASREQYQSRLVQPYEAALKRTDPPHPHLFVIPGNHDWYDSLASFTRMFCARRWFAGWKTRQDRSYFALKLPQGWWLLGTDVQLASEIDDAQVSFFRNIAECEMKDGDRVILCNAEPHWIYAHIYGKSDSDYDESNLAYLENKILKRRISVFLAGDLHHYRRHEAEDHTQKVTAGGGGAFLHPTHGPTVDVLTEGEAELRTAVPPRRFKLQKAFPPANVSRALCWRNWVFAWLNPTFGGVTAILYLLTAWAVMAPLNAFGWDQKWKALRQAIFAAMTTQAGALWIGLILLAIVLFTDTHSRLYRWIAGLSHGVAHLFAVFVLGWCADRLFNISSLHSNQFPGAFAEWKLLGAAALIFAGGWIIGSEIMGAYLWISLNLFGRHQNEAFSSLRIPDYKNFLRLHIGNRGQLTIYPVGIETVPRNWREVATDGTTPRYVPDDGKATAPVLIEDPVEL